MSLRVAMAEGRVEEVEEVEKVEGVERAKGKGKREKGKVESRLSGGPLADSAGVLRAFGAQRIPRTSFGGKRNPRRQSLFTTLFTTRK